MLVVVAILISTLGANNGIILTAARIPYAMARGGMFFRSQGTVHPYVVFAQFVFYALSASAVIRLRLKAPLLARPYRTWGYPFTPIVFIAFAVWLVYNTIVETPKDSAIGAGIILVGLPGYYYWRRAGAAR
jgi:basic amino acid/polyamine antiporter, APA family